MSLKAICHNNKISGLFATREDTTMVMKETEQCRLFKILAVKTFVVPLRPQFLQDVFLFWDSQNVVFTNNSLSKYHQMDQVTQSLN